MDYQIFPLHERYFSGLHHVFDVACKEEIFLFLLQAPPQTHTFPYYKNMVVRDYVHFVAVRHDEVVGWCDILPHGNAGHGGVLGIALLPSARGQGIGRALLAAAIDKAWAQGFLRVELTVRTDNLHAQSLYRSFGFLSEGIQLQGFTIRGVSHDTCRMVLLRPE